MAQAEVKALLFLAASDLREAEIRQLLQLLDSRGPSWTMKQVSRLRDGSWLHDGPVPSTRARSAFDQDRLSEYASTIERVESLLLVEAGLSKSEAARKLVDYIADDPASGGEPFPSPSKLAFDVWLARLCDVVPASAVLHHASKIRNEALHGKESTSSWPLSDR